MNNPKDSELDEIFDKLNGSGAHACYCERSTDGGCKCALKDEYLVEAKAAIHQYAQNLARQSVVAELEELKELKICYPVDPEWEYAVPVKLIDLTIEQLTKAQLKKGVE